MNDFAAHILINNNELQYSRGGIHLRPAISASLVKKSNYLSNPDNMTFPSISMLLHTTHTTHELFD